MVVVVVVGVCSILIAVFGCRRFTVHCDCERQRTAEQRTSGVAVSRPASARLAGWLAAQRTAQREGQRHTGRGRGREDTGAKHSSMHSSTTRSLDDSLATMSPPPSSTHTNHSLQGSVRLILIRSRSLQPASRHGTLNHPRSTTTRCHRQTTRTETCVSCRQGRGGVQRRRVQRRQGGQLAVTAAVGLSSERHAAPVSNRARSLVTFCCC